MIPRVHVTAQNFSSTSYLPKGFLLERFCNMPNRLLRICIENTSLWFSSLVTLMIPPGGGQIRFTATSSIAKNGPTWSYCLSRQNHLDLQCWKLAWSIFTKVTCSQLQLNLFWFILVLCWVSTSNVIRSHVDLSTLSLHLAISPQPSGKPGCKNIRAGGDSVMAPPASSESRCYTYMVYRSFKHAPPIQPSGLLRVRATCTKWNPKL